MDTVTDKTVLREHISKAMACKSEQKNMTLNVGFISPISPRAKGLVEKKNGKLRQQIKLLTRKTTLARQTEVLSQVLIHLNDQLVDPVSPYDRQGTPAKAPNTVKVWKLWETAIPLILTMDLHIMLLRVHWNLQWDVLVRQVSYFTSLAEGELLNLHQDPIVLLQDGPVKMCYT